uniref:Cu/Zn superoxide dismutase n=2 Tax=Candidatus Bipolaricaulota TaxID=67810 RepID=H5SJS3_9BACT|nr:Cu/Zn superoxide dismutase [uncultured Acetothermia bacterium]BAL59491.1 Cu/Zn superoxide dismutase [Candidatus Acetothermum autotrophicum]
MRRVIYAVSVLGAVWVLLGSVTVWAVGERAVATLRDAEGKVLGVALFVQESQGVRISVTVKGLSSGEHGIHIHSVGKCEPPDFLSAGPHFNPTNKKHGLNNPEGPHAGDLPNLVVNEDGSAVYEHVTNLVTLTPGELSLFDEDGSALVIHAGPDDQSTDPAGNSGARVLCGVITPMKAASLRLPSMITTMLLLAAVALVVWLLLFHR